MNIYVDKNIFTNIFIIKKPKMGNKFVYIKYKIIKIKINFEFEKKNIANFINTIDCAIHP